MSIGQRISELRNQNQLTQYQLAKAMEVSRQAVSKWENDQCAPDALNMIRLAELLDTDIEYLATGRRSYGMRPPVVVKSVETIEKVIEKPVVVEKVVKEVIESPVVTFVEKPVIKKVTRIKYRRNPLELLLIGICSFVLGLLIGWLI
jgi:transcriptional regulator with XRE-family HTH domain